MTGTADDDNYANHGEVTAMVDMSQDGNDTFTNSGTVDGEVKMPGKGGNTLTNQDDGLLESLVTVSVNNANGNNSAGNTVTNAGTINTSVYISHNTGGNSNGGSNTQNNTGTITGGTFGSCNYGAPNTGGSNHITNSGTMGLSVYISVNQGTGSSGGSNTLDNSGVIENEVKGSLNYGESSSGGSTTIINSGEIYESVYGSHNFGENSTGGGNHIANSGTVGTSENLIFIVGSENQGKNTSSSSNTIINTGRVDSCGRLGSGWISGSENIAEGAHRAGDIINNSGTVNGSIYGEGGDDTVTMQTGPDSVGGNIDGGTGSDTIVYSGGAWTQNHAKVVSFEKFLINATHDFVLEGEWRIDNRIAQIDGGSLTVQACSPAPAIRIFSSLTHLKPSKPNPLCLYLRPSPLLPPHFRQVGRKNLIRISSSFPVLGLMC